ncbi:hypothetical protein [Prevotella disiens]|uniref:hypothetical protein n=1 Tax=Prevotella disiens TaxID=28130 RepID=UPI0012E06CB4|nr:hypothetical protein [Prevotella disiens]
MSSPRLKLHGRCLRPGTNTRNRQLPCDVDYTYRYKPQGWHLPLPSDIPTMGGSQSPDQSVCKSKATTDKKKASLDTAQWQFQSLLASMS